MNTEVTVTTGARLHFGPLAAAGPQGGKFGGVGMMVSSPGFEVRARYSDRDNFELISGPSKRAAGAVDAALRVAGFVKRIRASVSAENPDCPAPAHRPVDVLVRQVIPSHCGLGSGTQLGLAVARALSELAGEQQVPVETLARRAGRGLRSAIGLHGFARGGFLVDGGRPESGTSSTAPPSLGTLVFHATFPVDWRLVLASPTKPIGLSGEDEIKAFAAQPPMSTALTGELCRIVVMEWLPAVLEADFNRCSAAMYEFGVAVGSFFQPVQGGIFAHPLMTCLAKWLRDRGITGIAQTSWGPTLAVLCACQSEAEQLTNDLKIEGDWSDCDFQIVEPLNRGAFVARAESAT